MILNGFTSRDRLFSLVIVLFLEGNQKFNEISKDADLGHGRFHVDDAIRGIMIQDRLGNSIVGLETAADDFVAGVIEAIFTQGTAAKALYHFIQIRADEVNHLYDVDGVVEEFGLLDVSGDAVEDEDFAVGMELVDHLHALDVLLPKFDRNFVGDELSLAGVFPEYAAHFTLQIE